MAITLFILYILFTLFVLYHAMPALVWEIGSVVYLLVATFWVGMPWYAVLILWLVIIAAILVLRLSVIRNYITDKLYESSKDSIPKLSKTEEEALNAGDVWVEQDIFVGKPDWDRLSKITTELSAEEQAFLDNETQELCLMLDEWSINQHNDIPEKVWRFICEKGFLGMVISKEYGGHGFSARAHSDVVTKIASRSCLVAVAVMVPNSLGPGELLHYYGTDAQRKRYLPSLAVGKDIPCFALTEPGAGSDATSIESEAIVIKKKIGDKEVLGLNISLNKRWITLAPIATLIGLAVKLKDPDGLLNGVGSEGITCLLIPRDTENLEIGNRHLPSNQAFMNGTIRGKDIFAPIDCIIGGQEKAGKGWQMLVECLSIGRSISLPALGAASTAVSYVGTSAFARIRRQFNSEIGKFEGIEEKLAEIAGLNYIVNATRLLTVAAVNEHKKPSVASAITKYFNTELARTVLNDAMDVHAGRAVVGGPRNYLAGLYSGVPISITVEGANIMSRNLLIFGQGSMACHPYISKEFYAISKDDKAAFSDILWQHIQYFMSNFAKAFFTAWTGGLFISAPKSNLKGAYKSLTRLSYAFAWIADLSLIYLGGELKRRERLSARLADGLSYLYMGMAVLRQYQQSNENADHKVHAQWALQYCFFRAQQSLIDVCKNFPSKCIGFLMRLVVFPLGQTFHHPDDKLEHQLAQLMMTDNAYRQDLKETIFLSGDPAYALDKVEHALQLLIKNAALFDKIKDIKRYTFGTFKKKLANKVKAGELTQEDMNALIETERARWDAIQVDEFTFESMRSAIFSSVTDGIKTPLD